MTLAAGMMEVVMAGRRSPQNPGRGPWTVCRSQEVMRFDKVSEDLSGDGQGKRIQGDPKDLTT